MGLRIRYIAFQRSLFFFSMMIVGASCTHRYYYPKPLQPPLLSAAKQLRVNGISNLNPVNPITGISLAGSPVKHFGLLVGAASASYKETVSSYGGAQTVTYNERQWNPEIATGYYTLLSQNILVECYGGWGVYNYSNEAHAFVQKIAHHDYFLQPSVALVDRNVEMAFTVRYDHLQRRSLLLDTTSGSLSDSAYSFLGYQRYNFIEPGITVRFGGKFVMAQFQFSQNFALSKSYETIYGSFKKSGAIKVAVGMLVNVHAFFDKQ